LVRLAHTQRPRNLSTDRHAQLTAEQAALVQKAVAREKVLIRAIKMRTPLVETYIQNTKPDLKLYAVPISDMYVLSRVDFGKAFADKPFEARSAKASDSKTRQA
jgi:hypothetical protein